MTMINGVNWHAAWNFQKDPAVRKEILDDMSGAGFTSVRMDYAWASLEPTKGQYSFSQLDIFINEAATYGMTVLVMLYWPPAWASSTGAASKSAPPKYGADFGNICGQVGKRYGAKLAGVEMWNEPDISTFWSGSRTQFFQMTKDAYRAAKAVSPSTTFVAAAPTYIGLASNWFKDAYASGIYQGNYDVQAIHPYMSPSDLPPGAPKSNWSVRGIADLQALRSANGDTTPLWATEWGWSTHPTASGAANHQRGVTEAQQATYTVDCIKMLPDYGVTVSYVYTEVDMSQTSEPHERNFGLQRIDYSNKPVVNAVADYLKTTTPPPVTTEPPVVTQPPSGSSLDEVSRRVDALEAEVQALNADVVGLHASLADLQTADAALLLRIANLEKQITTMAGHLSAAGTLS